MKTKIYLSHASILVFFLLLSVLSFSQSMNGGVNPPPDICTVPVTGGGITNLIPIWNTESCLRNSIISEDPTIPLITVNGDLTVLGYIATTMGLNSVGSVQIGSHDHDALLYHWGIQQNTGTTNLYGDATIGVDNSSVLTFNGQSSFNGPVNSSGGFYTGNNLWVGGLSTLSNVNCVGNFNVVGPGVSQFNTDVTIGTPNQNPNPDLKLFGNLEGIGNGFLSWLGDVAFGNPFIGRNVNFYLYGDQFTSGKSTLIGNVNIGDQNNISNLAVTGTSSLSGNVNIGTLTQESNLIVNGKITATEIEVKADVWGDYVFGKDYKLPELSQIEAYINQNHHLPGIPSADAIKHKGINIGEMNATLVEKVEELTLYLIKMSKKNEQLSKEIEELKSKR